MDWIRAHELALTQRLLEGLAADGRMTTYGPLEPSRRVAVVAVKVKDCSPQAVGDFLSEQFRIALRTGLHCAPGVHLTMGTFPQGTIRISPGHFTTDAEIDGCLEALKAAASCRVGKEAPQCA